MSMKTVLRATEEEIAAINKCYGRSKEELSSDLNNIKIWLAKQPHLPQDMRDEYLEKLLRTNKYSLEKTKKKIDMYYSVKNLVPEFFDDRDLMSSTMQKLMDTVMIVPLPKLTKDFSRVHIFRLTDNNPENFDITLNTKYNFAAADIRFFYDDCLTDTYILDTKDFTMGHVVKHNPVILKKAFTVVQQGYSDRIKGLHILNLPNYANVLVNIANSVLNEKMSSRVYVHKDLDSLHKLIPKEILPVEYGGTEKSMNDLHDAWRKILENNNSWIVEMGQKRSNEKLRPGPSLSYDIFGSIEGSFRQLNVD